MRQKTKLHTFLILFTCMGIGALYFMGTIAFANKYDVYLENYVDDYISKKDGLGAEVPSEFDDGSSEYFYEKPTVKALSHAYWALGVYDFQDNWAVDEFMRINECEIYLRFFADQFEWRGIREASRSFLKDNRLQFPTRFIFVLPIKLAEYNNRYGAFELQEDYQIRSIRRFELFASDHWQKTCGPEYGVGQSYARILHVEFSRPFTLTRIPMSERTALDFIKEKNDIVKAKVAEQNISKKMMYKERDAYLHMKVKFFAFGDILGPHRSYKVNQMEIMGILEGYSIYADAAMKQLFYSQTFVRDEKKGKLNVKLGTQYEALREKSKDGGILH